MNSIISLFAGVMWCRRMSMLQLQQLKQNEQFSLLTGALQGSKQVLTTSHPLSFLVEILLKYNVQSACYQTPPLLQRHGQGKVNQIIPYLCVTRVGVGKLQYISLYTCIVRQNSSKAKTLRTGLNDIVTHMDFDMFTYIKLTH